MYVSISRKLSSFTLGIKDNMYDTSFKYVIFQWSKPWMVWCKPNHALSSKTFEDVGCKIFWMFSNKTSLAIITFVPPNFSKSSQSPYHKPNPFFSKLNAIQLHIEEKAWNRAKAKSFLTFSGWGVSPSNLAAAIWKMSGFGLPRFTSGSSPEHKMWWNKLKNSPWWVDLTLKLVEEDPVATAIGMECRWRCLMSLSTPVQI